MVNEMKLKEEFIIHNIGGETVLVPTGSSEFPGLVRGNSTFGAILELLAQGTDEAALVDAMLKEYDAPRELIERDVRRTLGELRSVGAIEE